MDITGTFRKERREFEGGEFWGGLTGVEKIEDLDGGSQEVVVNYCFEGLEGRMGLNRVWEFIPKAGKKSEGEQLFMILVVLPEGGCWWTLSTLWKYGGGVHIADRLGAGGGGVGRNRRGDGRRQKDH